MSNMIDFVNNRSAWEPQDLLSEDSWKYYLTPADITELDNALGYVVSNNITLELMSMDNFVLPSFGFKLKDIRRAIESDRGITVLKGLPVARYSRHELTLIFTGIGVYLGYPLRQSLDGELLQEVYNKGESLYANTGRGTNSSDPLPWHTDRSDIVSLLCISKSETGGESKLASLTNVFNKIKIERPDLAETLCSPYFHGRAPFERGGLQPWYSLPIFTEYQGKFASRYLRRFIELGQDHPEVPRFTALQIEALDYLDARLEKEDVCLNLAFDEGDMQFINNFTICHSRNAYTDSKAQSRLLMRLWLAAYAGRDLAPEFSPLYGTTQGGVARGGILF